MTRFLDIMLALIALLIFSPVFILLAIRIKLDTKGNIFYKQKRVGRYGKEFYLYKFRSMRADADRERLLTFSDVDERITPSGAFMRKYKLDELPQLFNVLIGQMSMVGPRPEVKKYTDLYSAEQKAVLTVRPGITDLASITYYNENSLLDKQENPEQYYIQHIMPDKIRLNMIYIEKPNVYNYFRIILLTVKAVFK